jgi:hypothetical protein
MSVTRWCLHLAAALLAAGCLMLLLVDDSPGGGSSLRSVEAVGTTGSDLGQVSPPRVVPDVRQASMHGRL